MSGVTLAILSRAWSRCRTHPRPTLPDSIRCHPKNSSWIPRWVDLKGRFHQLLDVLQVRLVMDSQRQLTLLSIVHRDVLRVRYHVLRLVRHPRFRRRALCTIWTELWLALNLIARGSHPKLHYPGLAVIRPVVKNDSNKTNDTLRTFISFPYMSIFPAMFSRILRHYHAKSYIYTSGTGLIITGSRPNLWLGHVFIMLG